MGQLFSESMENGLNPFPNPLPHDNFFGHGQIKNILNVAKMKISLSGRPENTLGKEVNAGYQLFLLFPQCFPKPFSLGSLKVEINLNIFISH